MMIPVAEQSCVPDIFVLKAAEYADLTAIWAIVQLLEWGIDPKSVGPIPISALLEVGALRHLIWLRNTYDCQTLDALKVPSCEGAEKDLLDRVQNNPQSFETIEGATLSRWLFQFQMDCISWSYVEGGAVTAIQSFLLQSEPQEFERFTDELAILIYKHITQPK